MLIECVIENLSRNFNRIFNTMASSDQKKYIQFVNLFTRNNFFCQIHNAVISPVFNCICLVSKQRDCLLYLLPNEDSLDRPLWKCPSKVQRCFFSEDGKHLLVILSVNSFQIYKISEDNVNLTIQIKASVIASLLQNFKVEFSAATKVKPMKLKANEVIMKVGKDLVVCLGWGCSGLPTVKQALTLPEHLDLSLNDKFLCILSAGGIICAYDIQTGQKHPEELNARLANRNNADISVGRSFSKILLQPQSKVMALVNQDEEIILFDVVDFFNGTECLTPTPTEGRKDKWSWPSKTKRPATEVKISPWRVKGKVTPISGLVVAHLHFSLKGLFSFYSVLGQTKAIGFKVTDEETGIILYNFEGLVESQIVLGGPLPLVMSDSILSFCLGVLCNDHFILKLCEAIPSFVVPKELDYGFLASEFHSNFLKIVLSLHSNGFQSDLRKLGSKDTRCDGFTTEIEFLERKIGEKVDDLFTTVLDASEEDTGMPALCYLHCVKLLDLTHLEMKKEGCASGRLQGLVLNLLKNAVRLQNRVQVLRLLEDEWVTWRHLSDDEVIQEAVIVGAVGLAQVFLITEKEWNVEDVQERFVTVARAWVVELISDGDLEKAKLALANLGCEPVPHLRTLCLDTNEPLMRDLLATHLHDLDQLTAEELRAWHFCRKIEAALSAVVKTYHTFQHKMNVSLKDKVRVIMFRLVPYTGSIDMRTVLRYDQEWQNEVLAEVYFSTGDVTLEASLEKEVSWKFLLEMNHIDLVKSWIDISCSQDSLESLSKTCDYLTKTFYALFASWPVTENMLDLVSSCACMNTTKEVVLDRAAYHGFFSSSEKKSLSMIIRRFANNGLLRQIREVPDKPKSNINMKELDRMLLDKCMEHDLKNVVLTCLDGSPLLEDAAVKAELPWLDVWSALKEWDKAKTDKDRMLAAVKKSTDIMEISDEEKALLHVAEYLIAGKELSEAIDREGENCLLLKVPLVKVCWETAQAAANRTPDVTLYDLLASSNVPVDRMFLWQSHNRMVGDAASCEMLTDLPHFNHQILAVKYGSKQTLDYLYYLKQGRPSFACNLFIVESLRTHLRLTGKMIKRACAMAHGLALRLWREMAVGSACVAFIMMLGDIASANALRVHLAAVATIAEYLSEEQVPYICTLVRGIVTKDTEHLQETAGLLEAAILDSVPADTPVGQLRKWCLAVAFCNAHGLPLPTLLPRHFAATHDWFAFVLCLDMFHYPYDQCIELVEAIECQILKSHLIRALTRTTLKLSTTSPSNSPPKILLEPDSTGKETKEETASGMQQVQPSRNKDSKDVFHSFVTNVYTEVLNTIQTFTDKNIVLPWSCEQNPDSDVLLTVLKCESDPDTSKSLLISCLELQSPVLAVIATCYQAENVSANLMAWLVSSIPTSLSRAKLREEGQQVVDRYYGPIEVENLLLRFFSTGYLQTFYRGLMLFVSENPLTIFVHGLYLCVVMLEFSKGLESVKHFVMEISHYRPKDSNHFSRAWIMKLVAQLVESVLTTPHVMHTVKRQFLHVLADSELASVDAVFPNYHLWYQMCEILDSTETSLDFMALYDVATVSDELQRCLDELLSNYRFAVALELCSLLSLNKDRLVTTMWAHDVETKNLDELPRLWSDSSLAFKDENVNPNIAASFYYDMAARFREPSALSLKNRYLALDCCIAWRKCIEDAWSPSFKEESDSIELEKWRCCVEPEFDLSVLGRSTPVEASYSLLVSVWCSSKVLVRSQALTPSEAARVEALISMYLDQGDLHAALRIGAFFNSTNQDMVTVTSCLKLAHGEVTPSEALKYNANLARPRRLVSLRQQCAVDLSEYEVVPSKEQQQTMALLEKLWPCVVHGRKLAQRIQICHRLSVTLDSNFKDVASEQDYLGLLTRAVTADCVNKLDIVSDLITLSSLSEQELAKFLGEKIVGAVMEVHATGLVTPATLWDVNLDSEFHLIIALMQSPASLAQELLTASLSLSSNDGVEVLIKSHDCYASCCNVEGIGHVLRRARIMAAQMLQAQQWQSLVRLLVGIGRYNEMSYIFQMLKENDQFEHLLRKGLNKEAPGLHVAVCEYLQRHCPADLDLGKMVAAHFGLDGKLASLWQAEAQDIVSRLPITEHSLKDTSRTRHALNTALDCYTHAAQWFVQAGKLNRALKISYQAQLVALQLSLLGSVCVLRVKTKDDFQSLVQNNLSVAHTLLVARAYDLEADWVSALHERWVVKADKTFFADIKTANLITPQLLQQYLYRFDIDQVQNSKMKDRVNQLSATVPVLQKTSPYYMDFKQHS